MFKVMLATGTLCHHMTDFQLDGIIPCAFSRVYRSAPLARGTLGFGWYWPWDIRLTLEAGSLVYSSAGGLVEERFALADAENGLIAANSGATAFVGRTKVLVSQPTGWIYEFPVPPEVHASVRLESVQDLRRNTVRCANAGGHLAELTDANGRRYRIRRDIEQRVVSVEIVHGGVPEFPARLVAYEYDRHGDLVRVIDRTGADAVYQYDAHLLVAYRNRVGGWYYADYDTERRCIRTTRSDGRAPRTYRYDAGRRHVLVRDGTGYGTLHRFDDAGKLLDIVDPSGGKTQMAYDSAGGLLAVIDSAGATSTVSVHRDDATRAVRMTNADGCEQTVATDPVARTEKTTDCAGATWTRWYDEVGNLSGITTPLGATYRFEYDARGRVVTAVFPTGNVVDYVYTDDSRHLDVADSLGVVGSLTWDAEGRLIRKRLGEDNPEEYEYDSLGRMRAMVRPNGATVRFTVDAEACCTSVVNEAGERSDLEWSLFGELVEAADALGGRFRNHYDQALRLIAVTNASGERLVLDYDANGRPVRQRFFDGSEEIYRYARHGTVTSIAYPDGSTVDVEYDPSGRPLNLTGDHQVLHFEYDPRGYPLTAEREGITVAFEYDAEGQPVVETQDGVEIRRAYDLAGNCVSMEVSGLGVRRFEYDVRQRLIGIEDFNGERVRMEWDVHDRCTLVSLGPDVWLAHDYSMHNLLDRVRLRAGATEWEARYDYDPTGRVIRRVGPAGETVTFEYEHGGQLTRFVSGGGVAEYLYAVTGDPLRDAVGDSIHYDSGGRVRAAGVREFEFDGRGRVVGIIEPRGRAALTYDQLNALVAFESPTTRTEYHYDALGRRVRKRSGPNEASFIWDGEWLLAELSPDPARSRAYLGWSWRVFSSSALRRPEQSSLVMTDINGHPLVMANAATAAVLHTSDPWGAHRGPGVNHADALPLRFAGHYEDAESGLFYNRYRYYDPHSRRYLTPDPIRLAAAVNPYLYQIDPINNIDPHGLATVTASSCLPRAAATPNTTRPDTIPDDPGCSRGSSIHNDCITMTRSRARGAKYDTRADQSMEWGTGNNRPDLAMSRPTSTQRVYIEWDNPPASRAAGHRDAICANDPGAIVILVTLSSRYGAGASSSPTTPGTRSPKAQMGKGSALNPDDCGITDINAVLTASSLPGI